LITLAIECMGNMQYCTKAPVRKTVSLFLTNVYGALRAPVNINLTLKNLRDIINGASWNEEDKPSEWLAERPRP